MATAALRHGTARTAPPKRLPVADAPRLALLEFLIRHEEVPACVERCPVNIRIRQGIIKTEPGRLCLDAPASTKETWNKLRAFQTFEGSPAQGKA